EPGDAEAAGWRRLPPGSGAMVAAAAGAVLVILAWARLERDLAVVFLRRLDRDAVLLAQPFAEVHLLAPVRAERERGVHRAGGGRLPAHGALGHGRILLEPGRMRALRIEGEGGPEVLKLTDFGDPTPGPGEVAIRVHAAGLNRADLLQCMGLYP